MEIKILNINLYKSILIVFFIFSFAFHSSSQELILKEFKHLEGNTTARIYRKRDVNGQNCAVLIIKHNFKNYTIETGKGYEALEEKTGETWVWLSPDEYRVVIRRAGYIPFEFNLRDKLKELETYELTITDEFGNIIIHASKAVIWLDDKIIGNDSCTIQLKKGEYRIKATKENFYDEEINVILNPGETKNINLNPKPILGNLIINSSPSGAKVYINNKLNDQQTPSSISLLIGQYNIQIQKDGYLSIKRDISILENKNTNLDLTLQQDPANIIQKHKKQSHIWLSSAISFAGVGTYSLIRSNMLYKDYQNAGSDASEIRKKIERLDIISPVAYGISGLSTIGFIIKSSKQQKLKKQYNLQLSSFQNNLYFTMKCDF
ncbi:MAG: PEGA domain-containing protein [Bacteroidales bacterium]|jgi:hypothetical protein|nr:PEGA domain-containing protein [Bacteroidales bacterium]NLK53506.1 PEGA domain-containing protein [Bacteroidales bacterium]